MNWRTDWFKEAGYEKFPDTWDELLEAGIKLKKNGHPFGFELGHGFGDNHGWLYPLLWSYGGARGRGRRQDDRDRFRRDGARGRLLPPLYKETMLEDCLAGPTSATTRRSCRSRSPAPTTPSRSCGSAKKDFPEMAKVIDQSQNPKGPKGRFHMLNPQAPCDLLAYAGQAGGQGFPALADEARAARPAGMTSPSPTTSRSCTNTTTRRCGRSSRATSPSATRLASAHLPGWPAPLSRAQSETIAKYVVIDMFAKACTGKSTKDVIAEAKAQLQADLQDGVRRMTAPSLAPAPRSPAAPAAGVLARPLAGAAQTSSAG